MSFRPMLATAVDDLSKLKYPVLCSWKADGIRVVIKDGVALSRSLKPIPNIFIQNWVACNAEILNGLDGELIVGDIAAPNVFNITTSAVMSRDGEVDFTFYIFDKWDSEDTAMDRWLYLRNSDLQSKLPKRTKVLHKQLVHDAEQATEYEQNLLAQGAEGMMICGCDTTYKYGRSTLKEQKLLKKKNFTDNEYIVVGFEEKMHNANEAKINEVGNTERSSHKENMVPMNTLGALVLRMENGETFNCGTGFDDSTRKYIWENRESLVGKLAKIKHFEIGTGYIKPRFPVFISFRHEDDL